MFEGLGLVIEFEVRSILAHKSSLIRLVLIEPLVYLLFLGAGLRGLMDNIEGHTYMEFVFPGILAMQLLRIFTHSIYRLTIDRRWGLQALKISSGVRPWAYILGMQVVPLVLFYLVVVVGISAARIAGLAFTLRGIAAFCVVGISASLMWTSLAIGMAFLFKRYEQRDMWLTFLMLPLTFTAPVFYTLQHAPHYLQVISRFNPLTYQVQALRAALLDGQAGYGLVLSMTVAITITLLAGTFIKRAEYLPSER